MPMVDMPLERLKKYLGSNVKADDFDEYWKEQKELVDKVNIKFSIREKVFKNNNAKYYEIEFNGVDDSIIYAKYIKPVSEKKIPLVLEFHDYKEASKGWHHLSRYAGIGYAVLAMDARGQGGKSLDLSVSRGIDACEPLIKGIDGSINDLYYRKLYLDAYILSKIGESLDGIDAEKMICFGKGQGGAVAIALASLNQNIKKCSVQYPFLADFKRVWDMDLDKNSYEAIRYYFKWFDPMHLREKEFFERLSYIDVVNFSKNLSCEVLIGTGLLDEICPPSTQFAVYNNIKSKKRHAIFHKHGHELNNFFENENLKFMRF